MPSNMKKYLITALTLGCIAAGGALLIAGTNMITKDKIAMNEKNKVDNGIKGIFGQNVTVSEPQSETAYKYVITSYTIKENDAINGFAFRTEGSNMYGKVTLIVGFNKDAIYKGLSIVTNEQTYATTLVENYINSLNDINADGYNYANEIADVKCGATYGATLVRDMVEEARTAATLYAEVYNG